MPFYDYQCQECGTVFEQRRAMADADKASACPSCRSLLTNRSISVAAVIDRRAPEPAVQQPSRRHDRGCYCCRPVRS